LSGTVINRTTGKPTPNIDLTLLSPTQGMREIGSSKSDAQGHFTVTNDAIGMGPILVRATFHDVSFNTFAPPGRPEVDVEIYDISKDPKTITIASHIIIFQPGSDKLIGAEEYVVQNNSQPPQAFFRTEGNFDFAIPEKATLQQVSTVTSTGMPVQQASIEKGKGLTAIAFPFRPGETSIRLSYELPYPGSASTLKLTSVYPGVKTLVVVPPGVTITGDGLTAAGQEQGMFLYAHEALPAKGSFTVKLSGVASQQSADAGAGGEGQGQNMPQEGNSRTQTQDVQAVPGRLSEFKWPLLTLLLAGFAGLAILLSRKKVVVVQGPGEDHEAPAPPAPSKKSAKVKSAPAPATVAAAQATQAASIAAVNAQVSSSLDSLKDEVFRLELRKQAGTISDEEYAREKARVEKLLRDLVRG
jgi:hypothetical protein